MPQTRLHSGALESIAPFRRSADVHEPHDADVTGTLPEWLRGKLVRTCPAIFEQGPWQARHWFDGLGMIYAFRMGGASVTFQSRLLESQAASEIAGGRARLASFGTPTGRTLWQRIVQPVQRSTDNTNVNILRMGEDLVALTESQRQLRINPQSLRPLGAVDYGDDELAGTIMAAHPHFDFERDQVVNIATKFGTNGVVSVYEHAGSERRRRVVGAWRTERVPYVHSFGLTPSNVILVAHPFAVRPLDMLWSNRGYIDHFEWRPKDGTRLLVMNRGTGSIAEYEADPMFVFHTVNAFERGGDTVLDALAYPSADIMGELRVDRMIERLPDLRPTLVRFVMRAGQSRATQETLSDAGFEYPSTNYRRVNGSDYRFAWGAADGPQADGDYSSSIVKVDVETGESSAFNDDERVYGEPVFVARPSGSAEDDGVLLAVGASKRADASALVVIDAKTMEPLAMAEVPNAIPLGFHGSFIHAGKRE